MTTPHVAAPDPDEIFAPDPVLVGGTVHVGHAIDSQSQAADFGSYMTYTTPAGADTARPILPFDSNRHKVTLLVSAPGTVVAGSAAVVTPAVPATGVAAQNPNAYPVQVVIGANGATITNVSVNGITVGTAAGTYFVPTYGSISIAYSVAVPTWTWTNPSPVAASTVTAAAAGAGVWIGTQAQCQASPPVGGFVPPGSLVLENDQGLWMVGDGANSLKVTVVVERWS